MRPYAPRSFEGATAAQTDVASQVQSHAYANPCAAVPVDGDVLVWGSGPVAFVMTPDAAEETALRLLEAARAARG